MYRLTWAASVLDRLREILDYIASDDPQAAVRVVDEIFDRAAILSDHPYSHPRFPGSDDDSLRHMFVGRYRLVYRVSEARKKVSVVAIQHTSQRPLTLDDVDDT